SEDPVVFVLAAGYAVCGVWSLGLFFLARSTGEVPPIPGRAVPADASAGTPQVPAAPVGRFAGRAHFAMAVLWAVAAGAVAAPVFLLTPRSTAGRPDFNKARAEIAYPTDQTLDLNRIGDLRPNRDTAFVVEAAHDDGSPKDDLPGSPRWRGTALGEYSGGTW